MLETEVRERIIEEPITPSPCQQMVIDHPARYKVLNAGRRFGKSTLAVIECVGHALEDGGLVWYCAPYYKQVKSIGWQMLKAFIPKELVLKTNESELYFELINGARIKLIGTDTPDSLVGVGLTFVVLDEAALMDPTVWPQIIQPMLVDTKGEALFISTPRGYNWFHELYLKAEKDPEWAAFTFKTSDNQAVEGIAEEVEKVRKDADTELRKTQFRQEYEASFEVVSGQSRFPIDILNDLSKVARNPSRVADELEIYEEYDPHNTYVLGVDTSEGLERGDASSIIVLNCTDFSIDAEYNGKVEPDELSDKIKQTAKAYGNAVVVVESNNHGLAVLNELKKTYYNRYYQRALDHITNKYTRHLGFRTTVRTKPLLVAGIDQSLRAGLQIASKAIISELITFIQEDKGEHSTTHAQEGCFDDRVMALGCALQAYEEAHHDRKRDPEGLLPRYCVERSMRGLEKQELIM